MSYNRSNTNSRKQAEKAEPKRTPIFNAYVVREGKGEDQKGFWTRIGVVFEHEDGEGGTLMLDALPVNGRIVLRTPKSDEA